MLAKPVRSDSPNFTSNFKRKKLRKWIGRVHPVSVSLCIKKVNSPQLKFNTKKNYITSIRKSHRSNILSEGVWSFLCSFAGLNLGCQTVLSVSHPNKLLLKMIWVSMSFGRKIPQFPPLQNSWEQPHTNVKMLHIDPLILGIPSAQKLSSSIDSSLRWGPLEAGPWSNYPLLYGVKIASISISHQVSQGHSIWVWSSFIGLKVKTH